ncbi:MULTISPECIES: STAS domain-containing protein [unclassified Streptomyces]|uniref:STAS domain-containing protein n=1 Tax=unclassified Streptomyces TaxID=2593676 RepID=UPI00224D5240|nr:MULTISPECIES: STAS domain-containing protein [unclassified Streptomyces]MCX4514149.1 STAS domain-containing protein [Streptomyces sp. NBC_01619]
MVSAQDGWPGSTGGGRFTVETRPGPEPDIVVLAVAGELDHDTAEPLRTALDEAVASGARRILVDCGGLLFCDSTGLNVLLRARLAAQENEARVELAALRPQVARMLAITGAGAVFPRYASLAEALAGPPQE